MTSLTPPSLSIMTTAVPEQGRLEIPFPEQSLTINETDSRPPKRRLFDVTYSADRLAALDFRGPSLSTYYEQKLCQVAFPELRSLRIDRVGTATAIIQNGCPKLESLLIYRTMGSLTMRSQKWKALFDQLKSSGNAQTLKALYVSFNVPDAAQAASALRDIVRCMPSLTQLQVGLYLESHPASRLPWSLVETIVRDALSEALQVMEALSISVYPMPWDVTCQKACVERIIDHMTQQCPNVYSIQFGSLMPEQDYASSYIPVVVPIVYNEMLCRAAKGKVRYQVYPRRRKWMERKQRKRQRKERKRLTAVHVCGTLVCDAF